MALGEIRYEEISNFWSYIYLGSFEATRKRSWHKIRFVFDEHWDENSGTGACTYSCMCMKQQGKEQILTQVQNLLLSTLPLGGQTTL